MNEDWNMKVNKSDFLTQQKSESKERKVPTGKSFHEFMTTRQLPKRIQRKSPIFEMAEKNQGKANRSKSENKESIQHGAILSALTPDEVVESHGVAGISELIPEMTELVETMTHFIKIESENGVSTTTVFVEIEGSVFDGSQIIINHYDTAPHSFNLELSGTPEAIELYTANLAALRHSLHSHESLKSFQIELLHPTLSEKSDLHLRSKGKEKKMHRKPPLREKISF